MRAFIRLAVALFRRLGLLVAISCTTLHRRIVLSRGNAGAHWRSTGLGGFEPTLVFRVCRNGLLTPILSRSHVAVPISIPVTGAPHFHSLSHQIFESNSHSLPRKMPAPHNS